MRKRTLKEWNELSKRLNNHKKIPKDTKENYYVPPLKNDNKKNNNVK